MRFGVDSFCWPLLGSSFPGQPQALLPGRQTPAVGKHWQGLLNGSSWATHRCPSVLSYTLSCQLEPRS